MTSSQLNEHQVIEKPVAHLVEQIVEQLRCFFTQYTDKKNSSKEQWYSLIYTTKAIPLEQINWTECDYYQNMSDTGAHLHAYGSCKTFCLKNTPIKKQHHLQQIDKLYQEYLKLGLFINISDTISSTFSLNPSSDLHCHENKLPLAYCQIAFDEDDPMSGVWSGFDNTKLVIPKILFIHQRNKTHIIISINKKTLTQVKKVTDNLFLDNLSVDLSKILIHQSSELSGQIAKKVQHFSKIQVKNHTQKNLWLDQIHNIKQQLESNQVSKIVLARQNNYQFAKKLDIKQLINNLHNSYPDCTIIMLKSAHSWLIACSPEQLVKVDDETVYCDAVGGTINNAQSEKYNTKIKHEHILIREHIYKILKQYCHSIHYSDQPTIKKFLHLSHLYTHFLARLKTPATVLQMAASLHPTPAVCGIPVDKAKSWIKQNETFNRGLYSGFCGWLGTNGAGEMHVILRCAVFSQQPDSQKNKSYNTRLKTSLFAGGGIVIGSVDEEEWQETEIKFNMLLDSIRQVHQ